MAQSLAQFDFIMRGLFTSSAARMLCRTKYSILCMIWNGINYEVIDKRD